MSPFLDERGRRLFAANEAIWLGRGGVTAVAATTGIARSTINRGVAELKAARNDIGRGIRRPGAGRKREAERQPGLLSALEALIEDAIRGDPEAPLRWVSRSQRNIADLASPRLPGEPEVDRPVVARATVQLSGEPQDPRGIPPPRSKRTVRTHQHHGKGGDRRRSSSDFRRQKEEAIV